MTYAEKLKDPRWQKRRLEVLEAAHWKCESCDDKEKTLHVHHKRYIKGRDPWDYEDDLLECLCEDCHKEITKLDERLTEILALLDSGQKEQVWGYCAGILLWTADDETQVKVDSHEVAEGLGAAFELSAQNVIALIKDSEVSFGDMRNAYFKKLNIYLEGLKREIPEDSTRVD